MNLFEGQLLQVTREHLTIGKGGIVSLFLNDLLLVVETSSYCQARVIRMSDGVEAHITTIMAGLDILGEEMAGTYVAVPL